MIASHLKNFCLSLAVLIAGLSANAHAEKEAFSQPPLMEK